MAVIDSRVQEFIDQAMKNPGLGCCDAHEIAFRYLQKHRQEPGRSLDLELAAAEHYMFARWMVCAGHVSPTQMRVLVIGYDLKKLLDSAIGDPDREAVTDNPVSPPDIGVVMWGLKGVSHGSEDHDRCNRAVTPPFWKPIDKIFGQSVKSPYSKQISKTR